MFAVSYSQVEPVPPQSFLFELFIRLQNKKQHKTLHHIRLENIAVHHTTLYIYILIHSDVRFVAQTMKPVYCDPGKIGRCFPIATQ